MKKIAVVGLLSAVALAVPAQADKPPKTKPSTPRKCQPHRVAYTAAGTLVSQSLTQTAGDATTKRSDDRYRGVLTVNVTKGNHHVTTGEQTYTLTNAKVKFHVPDRTADGKRAPNDLRAGDRVKLHGKITKLSRRCDQTGFTPQVTIRQVEFKAPKPTT
jgi:hypothetical protein